MDLISISKFAAALVFVLCLMGLLAYVLRLIDQKGGQLKVLKDMQAKRRLQILERLTIDRQKTAVILRIDDREYLVISGPNGDTILESKNSDGHIVRFNSEHNQTAPGTAVQGTGNITGYQTGQAESVTKN